MFCNCYNIPAGLVSLGLYYTTLCSKDTVGQIINKILASDCINKGWSMNSSMNSDLSDPQIFLFRLNLLFPIKHYLFKDETEIKVKLVLASLESKI